MDVCEEDNALADVPTPPNMTAEEFANFVTMDSDLEIAGELSDAELLETASKKRYIEDESDSDHEPEPQNLSMQQKMQMVDHLRQFIQEAGLHNTLPFFHQIEKMVHAKVAETKKQMTLDSFLC